MTETFLICNTGSHAAILGLKWLDAYNPEIDWNMRTLPSLTHHRNMSTPEYHQYAKDELKAGKICPSKSSISSPVMLFQKDGSCRLVVNYRCLNNRTKKNVYPLPRPDDLMAQLCGAKVFTKLDLRWEYNNVQVEEGNEWKTAFCTK
ncbi:Retrotransposable element Tf2 protein [Rhizoctonia solani]|uniref:Retrotransposable element Tf2 protein n=1 Tax=Rhizoctonia solani TaxID=456999 RepID=A0A8H8T071_9AGAM|nr:Retrotransposable element Tf2 protein [Rhizoctonia solani]QRW23143.1 Retrotransposable element Tf2 protein [Rhizoctonia solani]